MIIEKNVDIVDVQTFKTNLTVRPHIDLGEISSETMKELWDLRRSGTQKVGIILGSSTEIALIERLMDMLDTGGVTTEQLEDIINNNQKSYQYHP